MSSTSQDSYVTFEHYYKPNKAKHLYNKHKELNFQCDKRKQILEWERRQVTVEHNKNIRMFEQRIDRLHQHRIRAESRRLSQTFSPELYSDDELFELPENNMTDKRPNKFRISSAVFGYEKEKQMLSNVTSSGLQRSRSAPVNRKSIQLSASMMQGGNQSFGSSSSMWARQIPSPLHKPTFEMVEQNGAEAQQIQDRLKNFMFKIEEFNDNCKKPEQDRNDVLPGTNEEEESKDANRNAQEVNIDNIQQMKKQTATKELTVKFKDCYKKNTSIYEKRVIKEQNKWVTPITEDIKPISDGANCNSGTDMFVKGSASRKSLTDRLSQTKLKAYKEHRGNLMEAWTEFSYDMGHLDNFRKVVELANKHKHSKWKVRNVPNLNDVDKSFY